MILMKMHKDMYIILLIILFFLESNKVVCNLQSTHSDKDTMFFNYSIGILLLSFLPIHFIIQIIIYYMLIKQT